MGDCMGAGIVQHLNQELLDRHMPIITVDNRRDLEDIESGGKQLKSQVVDSGLEMDVELKEFR